MGNILLLNDYPFFDVNRYKSPQGKALLLNTHDLYWPEAEVHEY